ncbi:unnamed protein product, partial [Staurois parvus]
VRCVPQTQQITNHGKSRRCRLGHVISCVQSQLTTSVPPVSVHQCLMSVLISATYQCLPVHINATYQCPSELPFSVTHQCHLSVLPISSTFQCQSVPPINISAHQCRLSVLPNSARQCCLLVPVSATYQCHVSVPIRVHQ